MQISKNIIDPKFFSPQNNLPGIKNGKKSEKIFAEKFVQSYYNKFIKIHSGTQKHNTMFIREAPVSGNGIADLLVFNWSSITQSNENIELSKINPTIRAFEIKLSNWKKGLMQAHRYKYFSNASFLVLPKSKLQLVSKYLDIFHKLRIGLWGFSPESSSIVCLYTPRPNQQQINKYKNKANQIFSSQITK